ncbi:uncharacterized protein LOC121304128 [Polyodon spathula]|uniref:uncharacterized protein LOC121304128 n=1 Tax=Polyodon spathula TaxID=7913 RepID=UPI001B7EB2A6|nr:uncharacterized protein LOC121304128 [Polyodon spathula]
MALPLYRQGVVLRGWAGTLGGVNGGFGGRPSYCIKGRPGDLHCQWKPKEKPDWCTCGPVRPISSLPGSLSPPTCLRYQTTSQLGLEPVLRATKRQSPPVEHSQIALPHLLHCSHGEVRFRSLTCFPDDKISLCLLVGSQGHKTLVEVPYSGLARLGELLALQVSESKQDEVLLSQLVDSVTTVDGCREDDIMVESPSPGAPWEGSAQPFDMNESHLDSFRSLFDSQWCRMPFHAGFQYPDPQPTRGGGLVAFEKSQVLRGGQSEKSDRKMEQHLANMHDKLRTELPNFFLKNHDYNIYSKDVEFINEFLHMKTKGWMYQAALTLCRFLAWNYFADIQMEVLKLTQHPESWSVQARWRVRGLPLHVLLLRFYRRDKSDLYRTYDAFSTFYLGSDGLIHCHKVDKMMPAQPPAQKVKGLLVTALVALGMQEHRPALNLLLTQLALKLGQRHC